MIVGRALDAGKRPVFDDGDEVVREGEDGLPADIMVGDHSGAFGEYKLPLETFAAHYARPGQHSRQGSCPIRRRSPPPTWTRSASSSCTSRATIASAAARSTSLFKHCKYDTGGSFAYRWECMLRRLDETNPYALVEAIRQHIWVLKSERPRTGVAPQPPLAEVARS